MLHENSAELRNPKLLGFNGSRLAFGVALD